jgi:hypothetical protein
LWQHEIILRGATFTREAMLRDLKYCCVIAGMLRNNVAQSFLALRQTMWRTDE